MSIASSTAEWLREAYLYSLPAERIAQRPVHPPESAKMLVINKDANTLAQSSFAELPNFLRAGDLLVFNDTRVIPARLFGKLKTGGEVELLLLERLTSASNAWLATGKPLKKLSVGTEIFFGDRLLANVSELKSTREIIVSFESCTESASVSELLVELGCMPIPPYIRKGRGDTEDKIDYQTFFAKVDGSIAAPTASLHFTPELVAQLQAKRVEHAFVTLHVGSPSFLAVIEDGSGGERTLSAPGFETYYYSSAVIEQMAKIRAAGGRVIAVGTTVVRALESMIRAKPSEQAIKTDIFIHPGFEFQAIDGIITNFHQPGSSHLLLVQAFVGRNNLEASYDYALKHDFRFLSYGDGMLIA